MLGDLKIDICKRYGLAVERDIGQPSERKGDDLEGTTADAVEPFIYLVTAV